MAVSPVIFGRAQQLFLFIYFILLTQCWVCTGHISGSNIFQLGISVLSPTDSGSQEWRISEAEKLSGAQFDYISLEIDYDYPMTRQPPVWSSIVKDLDISIVI